MTYTIKPEEEALYVIIDNALAYYVDNLKSTKKSVTQPRPVSNDYRYGPAIRQFFADDIDWIIDKVERIKDEISMKMKSGIDFRTLPITVTGNKELITASLKLYRADLLEVMSKIANADNTTFVKLEKIEAQLDVIEKVRDKFDLDPLG